jgi:outer membrane protein
MTAFLPRFLPVALIALLAWAGPAQSEVKVGVVNIPLLMDRAPQAEAASQELERRYAPREAELNTEREAIRKLEETLLRDADVMAASRKAELEAELRSRSREYKRAADDFKEDLNISRNEALGLLQREVVKAIGEIAKSENYDLVLTDNVVYASPSVDFTERVLERLQENFQASTP